MQLEGIYGLSTVDSVQRKRTSNNDFSRDTYETTCSINVFLATVETFPQQEKELLHLPLLAMASVEGTHSLNFLTEKLGRNNKILHLSCSCELSQPATSNNQRRA